MTRTFDEKKHLMSLNLTGASNNCLCILCQYIAPVPLPGFYEWRSRSLLEDVAILFIPSDFQL